MNVVDALGVDGGGAQFDAATPFRFVVILTPLERALIK